MALQQASPGETYLALIGGVRDWRALENRAAVYRVLRGSLAELNDKVQGRGLAAPIELTLSFEVQCLLTEPERAVDIIVGLADNLHPTPLVWGLGSGPLDSDLGLDASTLGGLNGPCFHAARCALTYARDVRAWLWARGLPPPHGHLLAALFRLMSGIRARWTDTQALYVREARGRLQKDVARRLGVSRVAVSKSLRAASFAAARPRRPGGAGRHRCGSNSLQPAAAAQY